MKKNIILAAIFLVIASVFCFASGSKHFQDSEYTAAHTILLHEPGSELNLGMLHPQAALFEKYFNLKKSKIEHQNYVKELNKNGIKTLLVRDVLMAGCIDEHGETIESAETKSLREFAFSVLKYDVSKLSCEKQMKQNDYKKECVAALTAEELVDIILLQPTVLLTETEHNTGVAASYTYNPLMNLFYTRDQIITTPRGVIICKLNSPQRRSESEIIKFCYNKIGITPILEVKGEKAFVEGGDFLLADNCSFIGCGMRTTGEAIGQMLEKDVFGTEMVVVVKDVRYFQAEMHLDTYFNIIDKDLVTLAEERMLAEKGDEKYISADLYNRRNGRYVKIEADISFIKLLRDMGMTIISVSPEDKSRLANNFLTIAPRTIMAVAGQSDEFKLKLKENSVKVTWLPLHNLTKGYGAAHCMTQVIYRK